MQLNAPKPSISHKSRRINKAPNRLFNITLRHLPRLRPRHSSNNPVQQTITHIDRDRAGRNRRCEHTPTTRDAERLSPRVADLCDGRCAVFLAGGGVGGPSREQGGVGAGVFAVQGWIEGAA